MASPRGRSTSPQRSPNRQSQSLAYSDDDALLNTRQIEAFGRSVHATAAHLIGSNDDHYRTALSTVHRSLRRPMIQRSVFSFAKANPRELIRSNFNTSEIEHRALTYLPDELLKNVPVSRSPFSLLDGFRASLPDLEEDGKRKRRHGRHGSKTQKLLEDEKGPPKLSNLKRDRDKLDHKLEMMGVRKTMCASEIKEIDEKIANLNTMRKVILERLADLEQEEHDMEGELAELAERIDVMEEAEEDERALAARTGVAIEEPEAANAEKEKNDQQGEGAEFMSESIYQKLPKAGKEAPSPRAKRKRLPRRVSMPVLHEHMEPGSRIREFQAHSDIITALDFDAPFGTMVTAALDDTVRVWDLNAGRCMGLLEGHLSSVRCLQVEDNLVATGSMDASIRLWDLSQADYNPQPAPAHQGSSITDKPREVDNAETAEGVLTPPSEGQDDEAHMGAMQEPHSNAMADCPLFTLQAHVAEITALNFRGNTLVSGSADKTIRQWDLEKGRCVQTLDVLWAAAQASTIGNTNVSPTRNGAGNTLAGAGNGSSGEGSWWRPASGRVRSAEADFVGALQVFDAALACGTADGMVRLWDLRSGMVHRSLVGHTGPVTALQFDDVFLVTGSRDRSIRIWDLRTGTIHDAFAYDHPITSMNFDARRIVASAGEDVVKVYDKTDGRQWDCGAGVSAAENAEDRPAVVERVRIKDGYLVEGRRDGVVGVWSC